MGQKRAFNSVAVENGKPLCLVKSYKLNKTKEIEELKNNDAKKTKENAIKTLFDF